MLVRSGWRVGLRTVTWRTVVGLTALSTGIGGEWEIFY